MSSCVTPAADRAYLALARAAEKIGMRAYRAGHYKVRRNSRGRVVQGYSISEAHREVVDAMPRVCSGKLSVNDAMALLHTYDVTKARFGSHSRRRRRR